MGKKPPEKTVVTTLYLVRHAKAGERRAWNGDDRNRPLSKRGWRQAKGLVVVFGDHPIDRLIASPYVRCRQTLEPLADKRDLPIEENAALEEGIGIKRALALVEDLTGTVVLCSHGDVIPALLKHFQNKGLDVRGPIESAKGSTWVIERDRFFRASYVPPQA